jgi:hypothetical protein
MSLTFLSPSDGVLLFTYFLLEIFGLVVLLLLFLCTLFDRCFCLYGGLYTEGFGMLLCGGRDGMLLVL